jgi:Mce-associated membrane protein
MSTVTESLEPTAREAGPQDGDQRRRRAAATAAVLVALVLAAVAVVGNQRASARDEARDAALEAARTRVPALLSYDAATLAEDLERAGEQTTGDFEADYQKILDEVVSPTAGKRGISTRAEVAQAGVVSGDGDGDGVVVLVLLTQTTSANDQGPTVSGSRVEVTLRQDDGDWKIAGLEPV